jgi:hypothetical protein
MLTLSVVALSILAQGDGELRYKDIPAPNVEEKARPAGRVFELPAPQAKQFAGLIQSLFGEAAKTAVLDDRLVVVAEPATLEFLTAIGREVIRIPKAAGAVAPAAIEAPPAGASPEDAKAGSGEEGAGAPGGVEALPDGVPPIREAILESLQDLKYSRLPALSVKRSRGGTEFRQSIELSAPSLDGLAEFIDRVKARTGEVKVESFQAQARKSAGAGQKEWSASIGFLAHQEPPGILSPTPPSPLPFWETFNSLRKILEEAGATDALRMVDLRLRTVRTGNAGIIRAENSTITLVLPSSASPLAIEKALGADASPFKAAVSTAATEKELRLNVTLIPTPESLRRLEGAK